ncbi:hypothetical protein pb186bvf_015818 [Paramecium bursaria]
MIKQIFGLSRICRIPQVFRFSQDYKNLEVLDQVKATIFQVLNSAAKCKKEKLSDNATFEELGFDSLDQVEIIVAIEEHLNLDVGTQDSLQIKTVQDAISLFYKLQIQELTPPKVEEKK